MSTGPGASISPRGVHRPNTPLTGAVVAVTLAVSLTALANPVVMRALTRDLTKLRTGQWWRLVTPVLVQPDGWGQLVFNLLGVTLVGAALERRTRRAAWTLIYLVGGVGGIAAISVWRPSDGGGGSSDAVAALVGALVVLLAVRPTTTALAPGSHPHDPQQDRSEPSGRRAWASWPALLYSAFFAGYLTALDVGGVWWSILVGNATIVAFVMARRGLSPTGLTRACLVFVGAAGVAMTLRHDGHGVGLLAGATTASLMLLCRRTVSARTTPQHNDPTTPEPAMSDMTSQERARTPTRPPIQSRVLAVITATLAALIVWGVTVPLLGVALTVRTSAGVGRIQTIGPGVVLIVSLSASLLGWGLLAILERRTRRARNVWTATAGFALTLSLIGPLTAATTTAAAVTLTSLHLGVAAALIPMLRRTAALAHPRSGGRR